MSLRRSRRRPSGGGPTVFLALFRLCFSEWGCCYSFARIVFPASASGSSRQCRPIRGDGGAFRFLSLRVSSQSFLYSILPNCPLQYTSNLSSIPASPFFSFSIIYLRKISFFFYSLASLASYSRIPNFFRRSSTMCAGMFLMMLWAMAFSILSRMKSLLMKSEMSRWVTELPCISRTCLSCSSVRNFR